MNLILLEGRVGQDPKVMQGQAGPFCTFSLATNQKIKEQEVTTWHRCIAFGKTAEIAIERLKKGTPVFIQGSGKTNEYVRKDGTKATDYVINVNRVTTLGARPTTASTTEPTGYTGETGPAPQRTAARTTTPQLQQADKNWYPPANDDDIPF